MKKLLSIFALLTLTSCGEAYETLNTPFNFKGTGINLLGNETVATGGNTFEVVVNGTAGMTEAQAMGLFDAEANRVCKGAEFTKQITSSGTANIREFSVKGLNTAPALNSTAPSLKGYVTCK